MANDSVTVIESAEQYNELVNSGKKTIIDFWADWCAPCKAIAPRFEKLAKSNDDESLVFAKVELNMEDLNHWTGPVTQELKVVSIPHFVALKNGEKIGAKKGSNVDLAGFVSEIKASE